MRFSVCDESSSSEDDIFPMLPETSSGELSSIEEEIGSHVDERSETSSRYLSSLLSFNSVNFQHFPANENVDFQATFHSVERLRGTSLQATADTEAANNLREYVSSSECIYEF